MIRRQVVIIGAGFGGLECAKKLAGSTVDVTVIDRHNYHVFTPLLYQVASALLNPADIAYPVRKIFRYTPNVTFRNAEVESADLEGKTLHLSDGDTLAYDYLVVAAGTRTNFFGNGALEEHAMGLKNLEEAMQLRNHVLTCLERASVCETADEQRALMTFVVVGAGPTGVEYAGALAELMRLILDREYPTIKAPARIVLVEGGGQLLPFYSEKVGAYTRARLEHLGVEVVLDTFVDSFDGEQVQLKGKAPIGAHTLVWSAGVQPEAIADDDDLPNRERSRRIEVDAFCRIDGRFDAFAIGDIASFLSDDGELPMVSPPAMQQGRYVADFILAHHHEGRLGERGGEPRLGPFQYLDKGSMATIGRNAAVCAIGPIELTGFVGWLAWLFVHIWYLIGYRNRLLVIGSWAWNYVFYDRPVRIIARAKEPRALPLPPT